ncbi:MAG: metallophosphoesterase, partial [Clostridia bacterium]|nr:metallophosphoesterase [Clostridia bacterium]
MKKVLSVILSIIMIALMAVPAFAADQSINVDDAFKFNSDGKFKIMMLNDCQDTILKDKMQYQYVSKAIEEQKPDLIVFAGDQVTSFLPFAKGEQIEQCIRQFFDTVIGPSGVPFVVTFGNHDHDWEDEISLEDQIAIYKSYDNCAIPDNVCDLGTYNIP